MTRTILLALTVALLATGGFSYIYRGYDFLSSYANNNQSTCRMALHFNVTTDYINFTETAVVDNCSFSNIDLVSFFNNDDLTNNEMAFTKPWANATVVASSLTTEMVQQFNGSACLFLPQTEVTADYYLCRMMWNGVKIYFELFGQGNLQFMLTYNLLLIPNMANNFSIADPYFTVSPGASGLDSLVVSVSDSCGATNTTLANLNGSVVVSASVDLSVILPNMTLQHIVIKAKGAAADAYIVHPVNSSAFLFNKSDGNCYTLPVAWSDLLSGMSYCANGCEMSMLMMQANPGPDQNSTNNLYVMETSGFDTGNHTVVINSTNSTGSGNNSSSSNSTSGSTSSNSSNSSNTTNSSTGGNTGTGNNNGNGSNVQNNTGNRISVSGGAILGSAICAVFIMLISTLLM